MAVTGAWAQRRAQPFAGPVWGTGYNPVHEVRDPGRGRQLGLHDGPGQPADPIDQTLTARDIDWLAEDYQYDAEVSEDLGYLDTRPDWGGDPSVYRQQIQVAGGDWLPYDAGTAPLRATTASGDGRGDEAEARVAIASYRNPVSGGWLGKIRGAVSLAEGQDPGQPGYQGTINTGAVQGPGKQTYSNTRATGRGSDSPRTPIETPVVGMSVQAWPASFRNGGGPGVPDLYPVQHSMISRPWYPRAAATPPPEDHTYGTIEARYPIARSVPPDPWQGGPESSDYGDQAVEDWGY